MADDTENEDMLHLLDELAELGRREEAPPAHEAGATPAATPPDAGAAQQTSSSTSSESGSSSSSTSSSSSDSSDAAESPDTGSPTPAPARRRQADSAAGAGVEQAPGPAAIDRHPAEVEVLMPNGHAIVYYATTHQFVAQCKLPGHTKCFKTRTAKPTAKGRGSAQGRPLGHLAAWLAKAQDFGDKGSHFAYKPQLAERQAARALLRSRLGSDGLLAKERPKQDDESEEPVGLP